MSDKRPEWRTPTVVSLCKAMRAETNYEAMPILADALEEAGFADTKLLSAFRGIKRYRNRHDNERDVCILLGGDLARAVETIQGEADSAGITYADILDAARSYRDHGDSLCEGERWDGYSMNSSEDFWSAFEAVTGEQSGEWRGSFFSCSC